MGTAWDAAARPFFPARGERLMTDSLCDGGMGGGGCWNFSLVEAMRRTERRPGMPTLGCSHEEAVPDSLLAGMLQRVVAAIY